MLPTVQMGAITILWYCIADRASSLLSNPITRPLPSISNLITCFKTSVPTIPAPHLPPCRRWIFKIIALLTYNSYNIKYTPLVCIIKRLNNFCIFTRWYNYPHYLILEHSCYSTKKPHTCEQALLPHFRPSHNPSKSLLYYMKIRFAYSRHFI